MKGNNNLHTHFEQGCLADGMKVRFVQSVQFEQRECTLSAIKYPSCLPVKSHKAPSEHFCHYQLTLIALDRN